MHSVAHGGERPAEDCRQRPDTHPRMFAASRRFEMVLIGPQQKRCKADAAQKKQLIDQHITDRTQIAAVLVAAAQDGAVE